MSQLRIPRGRRGAAATIVAVVGILIAVFAAVEAVSLARHRQTRWFDVHAVARFARTTQFGAGSVLGAGIAIAVIGLIVLLLGLTPGRRHLAQIEAGNAAIAVAITPRSLARSLEAATGIDGVSNARADRVGRHRVRITATTTLAEPGQIAERVQAAAEAQLRTLGLSKPRTVAVRLRRQSA